MQGGARIALVVLALVGLAALAFTALRQDASVVAEDAATPTPAAASPSTRIEGARPASASSVPAVPRVGPSPRRPRSASACG